MYCLVSENLFWKKWKNNEIVFPSISLALPLVVTIIFVMTKLALAVESQSMKVFKDSSGSGNYHQSKGASRYVRKKTNIHSFLTFFWYCLLCRRAWLQIKHPTSVYFEEWENLELRTKNDERSQDRFISSGLPELQAGWWSATWEGNPVHLCLPLPHATTVAKFQIFWNSWLSPRLRNAFHITLLTTSLNGYIRKILQLHPMALFIYPTVTIYILLINYNNRRVQEKGQGKAKVFFVIILILVREWFRGHNLDFGQGVILWS